MEPKDVQGKKYPSTGRCIYCGSDGGEAGLGDEHVVPLSLGATAYIEDASCSDCGAITSYLDGYLANHVFRYHRVHTGIKRRRRKKKKIPLLANVAIAGKEVAKEFERPEDHPYFTVLPLMRPPGILLGEQPTASIDMSRVHSYSVIPGNLNQTMGVAEGIEVKVQNAGTLNFGVFARAIAKIAYCNTIADWTLSKFRPLAIADLILGKYPFVPYLVGGSEREPPPPDPKESGHQLFIRLMAFGRLKLVVCSVRLFANSGFGKYGMPIYHVVVGTPRLTEEESVKGQAVPNRVPSYRV